jgi:acyl carrier protein
MPSQRHQPVATGAEDSRRSLERIRVRKQQCSRRAQEMVCLGPPTQQEEGCFMTVDHSITTRIIQSLAEYLKRDAATIKESQHLRDDLGLDSMAVIELLYKIEETFNLQIPDQDLIALTTVGSVSAYVQKRLAPAQSKPVTQAISGSKSKSKKG